MLWSKAAPPVRSLFKKYWKTGTVFTRDADIQSAKHLNPMFIYSSAGEKFNLHPATFPQGFHLAPAMAPTIPGSKKASLETEDAIVNTMKRQSESWAEAFLATHAANKIQLRFFAGDALALCRAMDTWRSNLNATTGVFGSEWHAGQLTFFDAVPLVYDVIETSSLTVNLDILNLLIATRPLLKENPASQSVLYTEERMSVKESDEGRPTINRLGTTIPTISSLLGLAPRVYISDFSTYSDIHETLAREHIKRFRERIAWVNPAGGDLHARQQKLAMSFDVDNLVQVVYGIYYEMFSKEITRIAVVEGRQLPYEPPFHYTRETVVMLLKCLRRRTHLKNGTWDDVGAKLLKLVETDWCTAAGKTYWLDMCLQLHLAGIHSVPSLKDLPGELPPVVCVAFTVPRRRLQVLYDHKEKNCTPVLEIHQRLGNASGLAFSSIHAIWGTCRQVGDKCLLEEDKKGFDGASNLVVLFWATSRLLGYPGSTFTLSLKSSPHSSYLFASKLGDSIGDDLDIFSAQADDMNHVRVMPYRPHLKDEPTLAPEDLNDPLSSSGFKPGSDSVLVTANVDSRTVVSLTARVEIDDVTERGVLLEGTEVKASQVSSCGMKLEVGDFEHTVTFPYPVNGEGYKLQVARKSHYVEVIVPFSKPLDNTGYYFDKTPILRGANPSPWNIPHVSSDRMPLLDVEDPKKIDWVKTLINIQHSVRERHILNRHDPKEIALPINHWVNIKNTIRMLTLHATGIGELKNRVFSLSESGVIYAVILVGGVRLDLASFTTFMDVALVPPSTEGMPPLYSGIRSLRSSGNIGAITTSEQETLTWKKLFPVFAERCRTWSHTPNCEYAAQGEIPLSTSLSQNPLCTCGQGVGFEGPEWNVASWRSMLPYATRMAICGLFAVTCSESKPPIPQPGSAGFVQP
ncbi:hypothetical protein FRC07_001756 [Ceratobasidium sp. 392]|nr:hypothetical protein FRC07_001756 [Ceratobasidium sp. 392]